MAAGMNTVAMTCTLRLRKPRSSPGIITSTAAIADPPTPIEGEPAPDVDLTDEAGVRHRLADQRGLWTVLYFYPADDTPGCTKEACSFRDLSAEFAEKGAVILGVSPDDTNSHVKFRDKFSLPFPLLSDPGAEVAQHHGADRPRHHHAQVQDFNSAKRPHGATL